MDFDLSRGSGREAPKAQRPLVVSELIAQHENQLYKPGGIHHHDQVSNTQTVLFSEKKSIYIGIKTPRFTLLVWLQDGSKTYHLTPALPPADLGRRYPEILSWWETSIEKLPPGATLQVKDFIRSKY